MWVSIDLCLIPIGEGVSLSPYVKACISVIKEHKLEHEVGPNGTAIEGEWDQVFKCIRKCHEVIHSKGVLRIYTTLKINTRTDKKQLFKEKVQSIISK
tara:strand:- start:1496 stop:1789 length:294 start_codon:yes stop_codon:yes gene_type:complete